MYKITSGFSWSPDGCRVEHILAGDYDNLPERAIQIADQLGFLYAGKQDKQPDPPPKEEPEQPKKPATKKK